MKQSISLHDWMKREKISQKKLGEMVDPPVIQALVSQWLNGLTRITLHYALQIKTLSKNEVTPERCAELHRRADF